MNYSEMNKKELLDTIATLRGQVDRLERYKQYEEAANETKAIHDAFVNAGFTSDQAFELIKMSLNANLNR